MKKRVLILVLSSDFPPYSRMIKTSCDTWDSIEVDGVKTIFYCSQKDNDNYMSTDKIMYFDVPNHLYSMGYKNLAMFEWALANEEFDYVARVNASCYVDKKQLVKYVQDLPDEKVFVGAVVKEESAPEWCWGGMQFIISKDVIQLFVDGKQSWDHSKMEDMAMSYLAKKFQVPFIDAKGCSIDKKENAWLCLSYGADSIEFTDFNDLKRIGHHFYRIKQDGLRWVDEFLMQQLFKTLQ